jgi:hypothetical protein
VQPLSKATSMSLTGHSRPGRANRKSAHVRYGPESRSAFRAANVSPGSKGSYINDGAFESGPGAEFGGLINLGESIFRKNTG